MVATIPNADPSFLEQIGPTLVAVILTGLVGLVSAWAGRLWERRSSHQAWLREQRLATFTEFSDQATKTWVAMDRIRRPGSPDERFDRKLAAEDERAKLGYLEWRIRILGPSLVSQAALEVEDALSKCATFAIGNDASQVPDDLKDPIDAAQDRFATAARDSIT